jgi:hypothetical protein
MKNKIYSHFDERRLVKMKFNFKKIVPVLTGAILLGSTIGFASSVSATSLSSNDFSADNAVVVIGDAAAADNAAALDVSAKMTATSVATPTGEFLALGGKDFTTKFNQDQSVLDVRNSGTVDVGDLPTLLAKGSYQTKGGGVTTDYEQKIKFGPNLSYTHFDKEGNSNPQLGMKLSSGSPVLNYTLTFTKAIESSVSSTSLTELVNTDITILGKKYKILTATNGSNIQLELMGGSVVDTLAAGAKKDYVLNGVTYSVEVVYVSSGEAKLTVNGESTDTISKGSTFKLKDGVQLGLTDVNYQGYAGGIQTVDFSLGADKLTLKDNSAIKLNDKTINDLVCYMTEGVDSSNGKVSISDIKLEWKTSDDLYLDSSDSITLPGLGSLKLSVGDLFTPAKEQTLVAADGNKAMRVTMPLKSGLANIDVFYANSSVGTYYTGYGATTSSELATVAGASATISLRTTNGHKDYFVATYVSGTDAESYLLSADTGTTDSNNWTTLTDQVTGSDAGNCVEKKANVAASGPSVETCRIGLVDLTIASVDRTQANHVVNITAGTANVFFDRVVSKEGLMMLLPGAALSPKFAGIDVVNSSSYKLVFFEEDKDGNKMATTTAGASFNVTVGSWTSDNKNQVSSVSGTFSNAQTGIEEGSSQKYEVYTKSKLMTKLIIDQSPTQDTATIEYHGGESYGSLYIAAADSVTSSTGSALVIKYADLGDKKTSKNLIVVGGPAANQAAADLLGVAFGSVEGFTKDQAMVKLFPGKMVTGKFALLVAGMDAKDTASAAKWLSANKDADLTAGTTLNTIAADAVVVA